MKYKGFVVIVAFLILLINIVAYFNTYVSEKYETQLTGIEESTNDIQLEKKKNQIKKQRIFIIGFSLLIVVSTIVISSKKIEK